MCRISLYATSLLGKCFWSQVCHNASCRVSPGITRSCSVARWMRLLVSGWGAGRRSAWRTVSWWRGCWPLRWSGRTYRSVAGARARGRRTRPRRPLSRTSFRWPRNNSVRSGMSHAQLAGLYIGQEVITYSNCVSVSISIPYPSSSGECIKQSQR